MPENFLERLSEGPLLCDGAYYLELERRCSAGVDLSVPMAVLTYPESVLELHREYVRAGAEIVTAMAFATGNDIPADRSEDLHRTAIKLAREAVGTDRFVAGDLNFYRYGGNTSTWDRPMTEPERLEAQLFFDGRVGQQLDQAVDLFILETFYSVDEVSLALPFIKEAGVPAVVTLTFRANEKTQDGLTPAEAAKRLVDLGADVVGANCARPWESMKPMVEGMRNAVSAFVCSQPNAYQLEPGQYWNEKFGGDAIRSGISLREETRFTMADYAREAKGMGVNLIGVDLTRFGGYLISWEKGDPLCRQHVHLIHLSSKSKWSNWFEPVVRQESWPKSSSPQTRRSGTGWYRPTETRAFEKTV